MKETNLKNDWKVEVVDEKVISNSEVLQSRQKKKIFVEIKRCLRIWSQLFKALEDEDAVVVHSCIPATTTAMLRECICAVIAKAKRRKFIIHYRCTLPNMVKSKLGLFIFRCLTGISDLALVLNNPSIEFLAQKNKTPAVLIPNFIEKRALAKINSKTIRENVKTVLYVGRVLKSKGCLDLIRVAEHFPDIEFRLVGKAEEELLKLDIPANVVLCGERQKYEVSKEYQNADIFMFLTYFEGEGFSNALVEAMANGLPCVATDWAANRDMLEDRGGVIVNTNEVSSVIGVLRELVQNEALRKRQSEWNIRKVQEHYVDEVVTSMYVEAYESVLGL